MEITTPNLDFGPSQTPQLTANSSRVKFDLVNNVPDMRPKRSIFGGILRFLGALSAPAFFFPGIGTAIGAAGMSAGMLGGYLQTRAAQQNSAQPQRPIPISYPGLSGTVPGYDGGLISPAVFASDPALDLVASSKADAFSHAIHEVR